MKNNAFIKKHGGRLNKNIIFLFLGCFLISSLNASGHTEKKKFVNDLMHGVQNEYFVHYNQGVSDVRKNQIINQYDATVITDHIDFIGIHLVNAEEAEAISISQNPDVKLVEQNSYVYIDQITSGGIQANADWGLDRIDQSDLPLDGDYRYLNDGSNVDIYIIDSGIYVDHPEFQGRAVSIFDVANTDCLNGHGTHVAGIAAGNQYGVAKGARVFSARAILGLPCGLSGTDDDVLQAIARIIQHKETQTPQRPAVVNMSFGREGFLSEAMRDGLLELYLTNIIAVTAAGNSDIDACLFTPGRSNLTINVGAITVPGSTDDVASFSNQGRCVDLFAPGEMITSAFFDSATSPQPTFVAFPGTSMAAPFVTGVIAQILHEDPDLTFSEIKALLEMITAKDKISSSSIWADSPNQILQTIGVEPPPPPDPVDDAQEEDDVFVQAFAIDYDIWYDYNFAFDRYDWIQTPGYVTNGQDPGGGLTFAADDSGNDNSKASSPECDDYQGIIPCGQSYENVVVFVEALGSRLVGSSQLCVDYYTHGINIDGSISFEEKVCQGELSQLGNNQLAVRFVVRQFGYDPISFDYDNYLRVRPKVESGSALGLDTEYRVKMISQVCQAGFDCPLPDPGW